MRSTRQRWQVGTPSLDTFSLPREIFELGLKQGQLLVYLYLICRQNLKHNADKVSRTIISKAPGLCEKTVHTHLHTLANAGLIQIERHGRECSHVLCPIQDKACERRSSTSRSRRISAKRTWPTGEVLDAVFPLPNEVFQLGLKGSDLLVYLYLQYQKGARSGQCWPSYATIGVAVGMGRKTVQKHVRSLIDAGLKLAGAQDRRNQQCGRLRSAL